MNTARRILSSLILLAALWTASSPAQTVLLRNDAVKDAAVTANEQKISDLLNYGLGAVKQKDVRRALSYFEQALILSRKSGNAMLEAHALVSISSVYINIGDRKQALKYLQQSLVPIRAIGERLVEASTLTGIGTQYRGMNEQAKALDFYRQALAIQHQMGTRKVKCSR
jgi:tetratricopeptide (TPR) repeat protein